ncbi:MAG: hypothetical protein K1060chlam5_00995 [Candidatus Anoxychlamydiales bacterium]|nr:hypothetical protein [Candidatus Anoxychlamydiales bacterium]
MSLNTTTYKSFISEFIDKRLIIEEKEETTLHNSWIQKISKIGGITISALGKIPFISINLKLNYFKGFKYALTAGNVIGFWALGSWSFIKIFDNTLTTLSYEERKIFNNRLSKIKKIISISVAFLISGTSQSVIAYLAYVYNNKNILMPIAIFLSDTSFPFYSTLLSMEKIFENPSNSTFEKKLYKVKKILINKLELNKKTFINLTVNEKKYILNHFSKIKLMETDSQRLNKLLPLLLDTKTETITKTQKIGNLIFGFKGLFYTINHLTLLAIVAFYGGKTLTSENIAGIIFAVLTVLSTFYLEFQSNIQTSQNLFHTIYNFCSHKQTPSLIQQMRPKTTFSLKFLGILIAALSWGPTVQVSKDYIQQKELRTYLQITGSLGVVFLISTAMLAMIDEILHKSMSILGSKEEKSILQIEEKLKRLINIFNKSSLLEVAKFLKLYENQKNIQDIKKQAEINDYDLEEYLSKSLEQLSETAPLIV